MRSLACLAVVVGCIVAPLGAAAADPPGGRHFRLTPHLGISSSSEYYEGLVVFSDGDADYLQIDPDASLLAGLHLGYYFTSALSGYLGVSFTSPDAQYVERDNLRPDLDVDTTEVDLGVLYDLFTFGAAGSESALGLGGGLSIVRHSLGTFRWNDNAISPDDTAVGVHGLAALDVGLTGLLALRVQLELGLLSVGYGQLEDDLARAEGEASSSVDGDAMSYGELSVGLTIRL